MQKVRRSCRKLAQKLSCMDTPCDKADYPGRSSGTASGSMRTPTSSSEPVTGATSAVRTPPHYSIRKGPTHEEDQDDDDDEDDDEDESPGFRIHHQRDHW
jgi:hypothetical protein